LRFNAKYRRLGRVKYNFCEVYKFHDIILDLASSSAATLNKKRTTLPKVVPLYKVFIFSNGFHYKDKCERLFTHTIILIF